MTSHHLTATDPLPAVVEQVSACNEGKQPVLENGSEPPSVFTPPQEERVSKRKSDVLNETDLSAQPPKKKKKCRVKVADDKFSLKPKKVAVKKAKPVKVSRVSSKKDSQSKRKYVRKKKEQPIVVDEPKKIEQPVAVDEPKKIEKPYVVYERRKKKQPNVVVTTNDTPGREVGMFEEALLGEGEGAEVKQECRRALEFCGDNLAHVSTFCSANKADAVSSSNLKDEGCLETLLGEGEGDGEAVKQECQQALEFSGENLTRVSTFGNANKTGAVSSSKLKNEGCLEMVHVPLVSNGTKTRACQCIQLLRKCKLNVPKIKMKRRTARKKKFDVSGLSLYVRTSKYVSSTKVVSRYQKVSVPTRKQRWKGAIRKRDLSVFIFPQFNKLAVSTIEPQRCALQPGIDTWPTLDNFVTTSENRSPLKPDIDTWPTLDNFVTTSERRSPPKPDIDTWPTLNSLVTTSGCRSPPQEEKVCVIGQEVDIIEEQQSIGFDPLSAINKYLFASDSMNGSDYVSPNYDKMQSDSALDMGLNYYNDISSRALDDIDSQALDVDIGSQALDVDIGSQALDIDIRSQALDIEIISQALDIGIGSQALVISTKKKKKVIPHVNFDSKTMPMWRALMGTGDFRDHQCNESEESKKWWQEERRVFKDKVQAFISCMDKIQGNRRFSRWNGSVLDSVMGVFLTQNVSDHLSSSAYMSLAAKYPIAPIHTQKAVQEEYVVVEVTQELCGDNEAFLSSFKKLSIHESPSDGQHQDSAHPKVQKSKTSDIDWLKIKQKYCNEKRVKNKCQSDSVDWNAVRRAPAEEVAETIKKRGQHNILAASMQNALRRIFSELGSLDLEWLRDTPPDVTKNFLLSIEGLGLKSVECIRLLALEQVAFPVDTNVGRIAVRLGWVDLKDVPEGQLFHELEQYPLMDAIQKSLWPRLCELDQPTLYELHYQMITFGKIFCKKRSPYCNACPLKASCKFFASASASARLPITNSADARSSQSLPLIGHSGTQSHTTNHEPTVEMPASPVTYSAVYPLLEPSIEVPTSPQLYTKMPTSSQPCNDIPTSSQSCIEMPSSPEEHQLEVLEPRESMMPIVEMPSTPEYEHGDTAMDIEDFYTNVPEIPTIVLNDEDFRANLSMYMSEAEFQTREEVSNAIVVGAQKSTKKLKNIKDLRTEHLVYEIPDSHPLLRLHGLEQRDPYDPCFYLLSIWSPDESTTISLQSVNANSDCVAKRTISEEKCSENYKCQQLGMDYVLGTFMIPCRTAMQGRFPLNGTYFQVNEVFADDESSRCPVKIPRSFIWNLNKCVVYCGSSVSAITTGLTTADIQMCFWRDYVCVRGFNRKTREPKELVDRLHKLKTATQTKRAGVTHPRKPKKNKSEVPVGDINSKMI